MPKPKAFLSQAWPSRPEVEWMRQFAEAIRGLGIEVFEDWRFRDDPIQEAVERALRESELIVLVLDSESNYSPTLFYEFGAAIGLGSQFVAVLPASVDPADLPFHLRPEQYVSKSSPHDTAKNILAHMRQPQPA